MTVTGYHRVSVKWHFFYAKILIFW
jgi:hypothetical protein